MKERAAVRPVRTITLLLAALCLMVLGVSEATAQPSLSRLLQMPLVTQAPPGPALGGLMGPANTGRIGPIVPVERPEQLPWAPARAQLVETSALIGAGLARSNYSVNGAGLTVAVFDTGLRTTHVDFTGRVIAQRNFTTDYGGDPNDAGDGQGHGTNVAGIVCANNLHVGIAPGANVIPLKVLKNDGSGDFTWTEDALQWVINNRTTYNITVCNLSLGSTNNFQSMPDESAAGLDIRSKIQTLRNHRIPVVISAGNDFFSFSSVQGMAYPAIIPESMSVGAVYDANTGGWSYGSGAVAYTTAADRITPFTQRLHDSVSSTYRTDMFAPGAALTSSGIGSDTGSSVMHGTSQAAPVLTGVIMLMQQRYLATQGVLPTVDQIETWLRAGGVTINDGDDENDNVTNTGLNFVRANALSAVGSASLAPTVSDISPDSGPCDGTVNVTITGTGFFTGATTKLTRSGQSDIGGTGVSVVSNTEITCTFDLNGAELGQWNVVVTNDDAQSGTLPDGFTVTTAHRVTITAGPEGDPNPVASGGTVACSVTAEDNEGHDVEYEWTATGGSFDDSTAQNPTWTAPENRTDATADYTITVTATCADDGDISNSDSYVQQVLPVPHAVTITAGPEGDPNPVASGGTVACSVTAEDSRDGHGLEYEWIATGGSFINPTVQNPTWTAPANRTDATVDYTITVTVTCAEDGAFSDSDSYVQQVLPVPHAVTITAGPEGDPNPVASGGDVACSVTAEDSREGHDLEYEWTATGGSFDDATAQNPTWTAPENRTDAMVEYTITVTVTCAEDDAFSDSDSYVQQVLPVPHAVTITAGPEGDPNPVASGGNVACSVTAEDSREGHGMLYEWTATGGSFDDPAAQNPIWTAPENRTDAIVECTITVTVTCAGDDAFSDSDSYVQQVLPVPHAVTITAGPEGDPNPVASGGNVNCSVTAEDSREGHGMLYEWTATGGSFDDATAAGPIWTAPVNTTDATVEYTITLTVTCAEDGSVSDSDSYVQQVLPVTHEVTITAGPQGDPNPVASGGTVACSVSATDSRDGHSVRYHWSAEGGSFDDASTQNPTWTAPPNRTADMIEYRITATAICTQDGSIRGSGSYIQQVLPAEHAVSITAGPQGAPNPVASGGTVACSVTAEDSREGHGLTYAWTATGGSFSNPNVQNPTWSAPVNTTDAVVEHTLTVTATCTDDGTTSATGEYVQRVEPVAHEVNITAGPAGDPNPVASGDTVACSVTAADSRDGHDLQYQWTATGGSFDDASARNPTWTAPANRSDDITDYTITVVVTCATDGDVSATDSFLQQVEPVAHEVNITAGPEGNPNPVASGGTVACTVTAEDSREGHDMLYRWTADGGSFDDATAQNPTWTAPMNRTGDIAEYAITVTVTCAEDGAVSADDSYVQQVRPVAHEVSITGGPEGNPNPVASGGSVVCTVTAEDTRTGHGLQYAWTATGGSFDNPAAQNPTWMAPENRTAATVEYTITVKATCSEDDSISASDSYDLQVLPVPHTVAITAGPEGNPNPVASGGAVACMVTAEDSRDGHELLYRWTATGGSFDDPASSNPTWTAPENSGSATAEYTITVTATCADDNSVSATASYTQQVRPGLSHTFPAGVHMVSVPLMPDNPDPAQLGFVAGRWARWHPATARYVSYNNDPLRYTWFDGAARVPGKGYWTSFATATTARVAGLVPPATQAYAVDIPINSWVQIGNPRAGVVPWITSGPNALRVRKGADEKTLAEARAAGWCEDFVWAYRFGAGYEVVCDPSVAGVGDRDRLDPWQGYWFQAYHPVELIFPAVTTASVTAAQVAPRMTEGEWLVPLTAMLSDGSAARAVVGQAAQARQMELPPDFGSGVQLAIVDGARRLGVELREHADASVWTLDAVAGVAGAQVTLQWPDISAVPHGLRPMLVDTATGKTTYMRTATDYTYTSANAGEVRRFEVRLEPAGAGALTVTATAASGAAGAVELRVTLSASASVDAELLNIAGRQVGTLCRSRQMDAGAAVVLWDAISARGTRLPGGRYLVRLTARADDGQQTSAIVPLQLGR